MGVNRKQDEALSSEQVLAILEVGEAEWLATEDPRERREIENVLAFVVIGYGASLRGEEVPLASIRGILAFWEENVGQGFLTIALRGKFKGEDNLRWHLAPIVDETGSGIMVRKWVHRLLKARLGEIPAGESQEGPLFVNQKGERASIADYDEAFRELVGKAMLRHPDKFSKKSEVQDFSLRRSLRRGSTTQALNNNVAGPTVDLINRWRKREGARGSEPGLAMRQVYTQVRSSLDTMLRYSQSL